MTNHPQSKNPFEIQAINNQLVEQLPLFLAEFGVDYVDYKNRVAFSCPVHNSDKYESACIFKNGTTYNGNFKCWTRQCEDDVGPDAYSLFQHLLKKKIVV